MNAVMRFLSSPFRKRRKAAQELETRKRRRQRMVQETEVFLKTHLNPRPGKADRMGSSGGRSGWR